MQQLNYNHLQYFWAVAKEGSISGASKLLHLTPQTISGQLKLLEESVGEPLFHRVGRGLVLTDTGHLVKHYADDIFSTGAELAQRINEKQPDASLVVNVGVVDSIPKLIAYRVLEPVLRLESPVKLVCHEGSLDQLLGDLALHRIDMVLSNRPLPKGLGVKAYNHRLGSSEIGWFAEKKLSEKFTNYSESQLDGAAFLLPETSNVMRREIDAWFEERDITPRVVAEFADSALLKMFGEGGAGVFPSPTAISSEIEQSYQAQLLGLAKGLREHYFAITPERRLKNSAVVHINDVAHEWLDE